MGLYGFVYFVIDMICDWMLVLKFFCSLEFVICDGYGYVLVDVVVSYVEIVFFYVGVVYVLLGCGFFVWVIWEYINGVFFCGVFCRLLILDCVFLVGIVVVVGCVLVVVYCYGVVYGNLKFINIFILWIGGVKFFDLVFVFYVML